MKYYINSKVFCLLKAGVFLSICMLAGLAAWGAELFYDGFEIDGFNGEGWTVTGAVVQGSYKYAGNYAAAFNGSSDSISIAVSTAGHRNIKIEYNRQITCLESSDYFICEWYNGESNVWLEAEKTTSTSSPFTPTKSWSLGSWADNNPNFQIRFKTENCTDGDDWIILDEVRVTGESIGSMKLLGACANYYEHLINSDDMGGAPLTFKYRGTAISTTQGQNDFWHLLGNVGMDAVRIRVFANDGMGTYPENMANLDYALETAWNAYQAGHSLIVSIFLSDGWSDVAQQPASDQWDGEDLQTMCGLVENFCETVATAFEQYGGSGIPVAAWAIGNEIDLGISGYYYESNDIGDAIEDNNEQYWDEIAAICAAGQAGVKSVFSNAKFFHHLCAHYQDIVNTGTDSDGHDYHEGCDHNNDHCYWVQRHFRWMMYHGVQIDYLGLSYYAAHEMLRKKSPDALTWFQELCEHLVDTLNRPIIIPEWFYPASPPVGMLQSHNFPVPGYPKSEQGQADYVADFTDWAQNSGDIAGTFFFSPELVKDRFYVDDEWIEWDGCRPAVLWREVDTNVCDSRDGLDSFDGTPPTGFDAFSVEVPTTYMTEGDHFLILLRVEGADGSDIPNEDEYSAIFFDDLSLDFGNGNVLQNGGFENGTTEPAGNESYWNGDWDCDNGTITASGTKVNTGTKGMEWYTIQAADGAGNDYAQVRLVVDVPASVGENVVVSGYVNVSELTDDRRFRCVAGELGDVSSFRGSPYIYGERPTPPGWVEVSGQVDCVPGDTVVLLIRATGPNETFSASGDEVFIDDLVLTYYYWDGDSYEVLGAANRLSNGGFEGETTAESFDTLSGYWNDDDGTVSAVTTNPHSDDWCMKWSSLAGSAGDATVSLLKIVNTVPATAAYIEFSGAINADALTRDHGVELICVSTSANDTWAKAAEYVVGQKNP